MAAYSNKVYTPYCLGVCCFLYVKSLRLTLKQLDLFERIKDRENWFSKSYLKFSWCTESKRGLEVFAHEKTIAKKLSSLNLVDIEYADSGSPATYKKKE